MTGFSRRALSILVVGFLVLAAGAVVSQAATTTETRNFEIISVDGNRVVYKTADGVREATLPADFKLTMDGRSISVADLKPGMKGTATMTTTTTSIPVTVTEIRNGEVMAVSGNTIIAKTAQGYKKFTQKDVSERGITIVRDGQRVDLHQLRVGDKLSAQIITQGPPTIVTDRDVSAAVQAVAAEPPPAPMPTMAPAPAMAPAPDATMAPAGEMAPAPEATMAPAEPAPAAEMPAAEPVPEKKGLSTLVWVGIVILALIIVIFLVRRRDNKS